jgi:hypothetical protein
MKHYALDTGRNGHNIFCVAVPDELESEFLKKVEKLREERGVCMVEEYQENYERRNDKIPYSDFDKVAMRDTDGK